MDSIEEPPETDLDYYSRPENYIGSSLNAFTKFRLAKEKEKGANQAKAKTKSNDESEERKLFRRYRHILPRDGLLPQFSSSSEDFSDDNEEKHENKPTENKLENSEIEQRKESGDSEIYDPNTEETNEVGGNFLRSDMLLQTENSNETNQAEPGADHVYSVSLNKNDSITQEKRNTEENKAIVSTNVKVTPRKESCLNELSDFCKSDSINQITEANQTKFSTNNYNSRRRSTIYRSNKNTSKINLTAFPIQNQFKFRALITKIINVLKLAKAIIKPSDSPSELLKTFTSTVQQSQHLPVSDSFENYGLHFDASFFRANREISVSNEVKNILCLPPDIRTPEQIQTAIFGLQSLQSFAEYPLHMQAKLVKVAWFEIVPPMRTIIRQGHLAENFYFILSGQALVTIQKPGEAHPQTAAMMRKGTSFGELALLHHSRRTATVTSHDTVQLLSIGRKDFFQIFMSQPTNGDMPEHIKFISQLNFMKDWPLERLLERPDQCLLHFYKRNTVIIQDNKLSEWFYIVKSGSCHVLKQLKKDFVRLRSASTYRRRGRPQSGLGSQSSRIDAGQSRRMKKIYREELFIQTFQDSESLKSSVTFPVSALSSDESCEDTESSKSDQDKSIDLVNAANTGLSKPFSKICYSQKPDTGTAHFQRKSQLDSESLGKSQNNTKLHNDSLTSKRTGSSNSRNNSTKGKSVVSKECPNQDMFVCIQVLKPGDVFGLDVVKFDNQNEYLSSTVSLVSLGAECIMLSKSFFIKHANDKVKKNFSELVQPYPDEASLQENLQVERNWEQYKSSLLSNILHV